MNKEGFIVPWNLEHIKQDLDKAFLEKSENQLLAILKNNSFLFYELFSRKYGIQPIFHEVPFGSDYKCDFAWLNDNSDGPEWVLVEIENPKLNIFKRNGEPSHFLNHAIEQVKTWRKYFNDNPSDKRKIFGAVTRFRYILVVGDKESWKLPNSAKWRIDHNREDKIEIRTSDIFYRALKILEEHPSELWSFAENDKTLLPSKLKDYWENNDYISYWRNLTN
jgi:hypothetical protein